MKIEIISKETIRPSLPTPSHLKSYRLSLLDQLAPPTYVPIVLFYSADGFPTGEDHSTMYDRLKKSLAETLTRFYPLAGKINGSDASVDLDHDEAVIVVRAHASIQLSKILENPHLNSLKQLLPLNPHKILNADKSVPVMAVQLNFFSCGGMGIGVCTSHKVADGETLATFLNAWAETSRGAGETITPCLTSATLFPPKDVLHEVKPADLVAKEKTLTKTFVFDATSLATLKAKAAAKGGTGVDDPTRVEAVTALISRSAKNARRGKSLQGRSSMVITHVVNLRARAVPPLIPEHAFGNIWQLTIAPIFEEENKTAELHDLVVQLRRAIRKIDDNYVKKLQGEDGLYQARQPMREVIDIVSKGEVEFYTFSSWVGFPFYETDFGWGRPVWICINNMPIKNVVKLISTRSGTGIEAWVSLEEEHMAKFENDQELLQFAFPASSS